MLPYLWQFGYASDYVRFYRDFLAHRWAHLSPMEYGIILISVSVVGYLMMRNSTRH